MIVYRILMPMIAGILFAGVVGCEDSGTSSDCKTPPKEQWSENLITNSSFEFNGQPTFVGWSYTTWDSLTQDAPDSGGEWCALIGAGWIPEINFIATWIPDIQDGDILRLSSYVRSYPGGHAHIGLLAGDSPNPYSDYLMTTGISSADWTRLVVQDTLENFYGDSVWVVLSEWNSAEIALWASLFDLVTLQRVEN